MTLAKLISLTSRRFDVRIKLKVKFNEFEMFAQYFNEILLFLFYYTNFGL